MEKNKDKKEKKERKRMRRKGEKKKERKEDLKASSSNLPTFRRLEFVGPRVKVLLLYEGYAPRGMDSFYFGLFPPKGCLAVFSILRGFLAGFFIGLPCVDPTLCVQFGTGFRLGK